MTIENQTVGRDLIAHCLQSFHRVPSAFVAIVGENRGVGRMKALVSSGKAHCRPKEDLLHWRWGERVARSWRMQYGSSIQWTAVSDGVLRDTERRSATRLNLDSIMDTKRYLPSTKISTTKASPLYQMMTLWKGLELLRRSRS